MQIHNSVALHISGPLVLPDLFPVCHAVPGDIPVVYKRQRVSGCPGDDPYRHSCLSDLHRVAQETTMHYQVDR